MITTRPLGIALILASAASASTVGSASAQVPILTPLAREVFTYPAFGRRDPFQPLNIGEQGGPRFSDLRLSGVLFNPGLGSVATLTDRKTGRRYRAREDDVLGEARVVRIRAGEVDFEITNFGVSRSETLRVRRQRGTGR
ncbi:hypothetical protein [Candidatus Palauibacter sp.]|uniref:hypothetical protein n=1 Tax=Candidatus Palauibacter sp. TaxID=3101350 RepID=UPI003AF2CE10